MEVLTVHTLYIDRRHISGRC